MDIKQNFLWELKEASIVEFQWASKVNNEAEIFTKNLIGQEHNKHVARLCVHNKYYSTMQDR